MPSDQSDPIYRSWKYYSPPPKALSLFSDQIVEIVCLNRDYVIYLCVQK